MDYKSNHNGKGEYRVINNCPVCKGAVFIDNGGYKLLSSLHRCFQCGRFYILNRDKQFELWIKPADHKASPSLKTTPKKGIAYLFVNGSRTTH
jgi:hypothetical protein